VFFAVVYGFIFFREWPDAWSFGGMAIIVAAGIYMIRRETLRMRQRSAHE